LLKKGAQQSAKRIVAKSYLMGREERQLPKRVEYQKFVRNKLDNPRYSRLFGLSDNIEIMAEEDIVLQREFRIDLILVKKDESIPLEGIFSYFKEFNHLELKSINDPFNIKLLWKYISQMGWWFYFREDEKQRVNPKQVTLTVISIRRPREVIKFLEEIGVEYVETAGYVQWNLMGVDVRILIVNRLELTEENYGWLTLSEGKTYEIYLDTLVFDIKRDEKYDIYLELLDELEKEGKDRMAERILTRIIDDLPPERLQRVVSGNAFGRLIENFPPEELPEGALCKLIERLPPEKLSMISRNLIKNLPPDQLQDILSEINSGDNDGQKGEQR